MLPSASVNQAARVPSATWTPPSLVVPGEIVPPEDDGLGLERRDLLLQVVADGPGERRGLVGAGVLLLGGQPLQTEGLLVEYLARSMSLTAIVAVTSRVPSIPISLQRYCIRRVSGCYHKPRLSETLVGFGPPTSSAG